MWLIFWCVLGVSEDLVSNHRLYDVEVIELSKDVSFLLLLPPVENVCLVPGQSDELSERKEFQSIPVQVFEICKYYFIALWSICML